jgi:exoribonuclease R
MVNLDRQTEDFVYDEENMRLTGLKSNTKYQIGDKVLVKVAKTSLKDKQIDLSLV